MAIDILKTKISTPRANIEEYKFCLYSTPKGGKTTLFVKLIEKIYGDTKKGFIIKTEEGTKGLTTFGEKANNFNEVKELVDQLVQYKDKLDIKVVAIDTIDKMFVYAKHFVLKREGRKDGKKYLAVNDIPWGKGWGMIEDAIVEQLEKLENAGYGIFVIAHDKTKRFESRDGISYDQTTIDMHERLRGAILNFCDFITFIDIAKEKDESGNIKDKRYIYFRSDGSDIVAGSRFADVPEKVEYGADNFIKAFEQGVNGALQGQDIKKIKKKQEKENKKKSEDFIKEETKRSAEDIAEEIKVKYMDSSEGQKGKMKELMAEYEIADFKEPESASYEGLEKILEILS